MSYLIVLLAGRDARGSSDVTSPIVEATIERIAAVLASANVGQVEVSRMMNRFLAEAEAALPEVR